MCVCVCVCVCVRERERERVCVRVCVHLTEANIQQIVKYSVQNVRFIMINAVSYPSGGNFIFVFPTISA